MRARFSAVIALLALAVVAGSILISSGVPGRAASVNGADLLNSVMEHIEDRYIDSTARGELYEFAMEGMLRRLGDPHAAYISAERLALLREKLSGDHVGPGMEIDERAGSIVLVAPIPGSPAQLAGLRAGDRIRSVNGRLTFGMSVEEVELALKGSAGTRVDVSVERAGTQRPIVVTLTRQLLPRHSVGATLAIGEGVGYVRLESFRESAANEVREAIDSLQEQGIRVVLLDLRGNPGGLLEEGIAVADLFLPAGLEIASMRGRAAGEVEVFRDDTAPRWTDLGLIVLVDGGTASASEIVAGALQDHDRGVVIGRTTFGKGSAQTLVNLANGGALKITTGRWYTPLGRSLEGEPLVQGSARTAIIQPREFRTPQGRTVRGGRGITPDVLVNAEDAAAAALLTPDVYVEERALELPALDPFIRLGTSLSRGAASQADLYRNAAAAAADYGELVERP